MSKTDELLGKLGKQMRDFPQVSTFAGAKQAESAIAKGNSPEAPAAPPERVSTIPPLAVAAPASPEVLSKPQKSRRLKQPAEAVPNRSVRNFSVTLHPSDIDTMQEMRFLIMKEAKKPTVSISETIRIALRAFRSEKPLSEIIAEVEELDGRGMWRK